MRLTRLMDPDGGEDSRTRSARLDAAMTAVASRWWLGATGTLAAVLCSPIIGLLLALDGPRSSARGWAITSAIGLVPFIVALLLVPVRERALSQAVAFVIGAAACNAAMLALALAVADRAWHSPRGWLTSWPIVCCTGALLCGGLFAFAGLVGLVKENDVRTVSLALIVSLFGGFCYAVVAYALITSLSIVLKG
jgi:hypothetical protein